ncbi:ricin-type beta-trefoil lectin domain protein [Streptomyces sp. NBC_01275]|uniref:ricin-type beta-trefoil lectin domain protein n=1 Tax=Streptomyces sp. NBC_01275 TaxID=2903807 RepID=UPI002251E950|nr:ricin-type beta-trefoil lectin domain protein [Streptomyces sp. NBC_01275]MCX4767056.1 ricin-type beta-trefoil lectin domain protein [Streptomyces sp. NBC_01275]
MLTPRPPRPPFPPPGSGPGESDESLAAGIRGGADSEVAESTALLIARHWRPVHEYAVICLASSGSVAAMLTAAAFHQVFDRLKLGEPGTALRPRLLVTVRDMARLWSADEGISGVLPVLQKPAGARGMRAAKSMIPENRVLAERAFQGLPPVARCVLWHVEVEAESVTVAAGLLGMDTETVAAALDQARDKLREGLVRAHRELAPSKDCRFHNRLLDVPIRRGGDLLPDVRRHLDECRYCRAAAEQLGHFEGGLGVLLAEAVLGWGARRYHESRPGRAKPQTVRLRGSARHRGGRPRGGRGALLARIPSPRRRASGDGPRSPRALLTGVGLASAGLLTTLLAVGLWPDDGGADPAASTSGAVPGTDSQAATVSPTAPGTAQLPTAPRQTRLRNTAADLCLGIRGEAKAGAAVELADCSSDAAQQWSYDDDGQLRSVAAPGLCVDSHADAGVVILGECADAGDARGDDVRYDLTVQGELLPRWDDALALTTAGEKAGDDIVVKVRDHTAGQRWQIDAASATPGSLAVTGTDAPPSAQPVRLEDGTA